MTCVYSNILLFQLSKKIPGTLKGTFSEELHGMLKRTSTVNVQCIISYGDYLTPCYIAKPQKTAKRKGQLQTVQREILFTRNLA
jgi:hypothetical protein